MSTAVLSEVVGEKFWPKVDASGVCWEWTGNLMWNGYGRFYLDGRNNVAHRVAYELLVGAIPDGLVIDHLCRVRHCVCPDHLEVVTRAVNNQRGFSPGILVKKMNTYATHCWRGHEYTAENTYVDRPTGNRFCRICRRISNRAFKQRRKAA